MELFIDLKNTANIGQSIVPASISATTNGAGVDLQNADGRCNAIIDNGVVTGAFIYNVQMQGSLDNSTNWTNEADANALSANISAAGITVLSYIRTFRYQRAVLTKVSGTSSLVGVHILEQKRMIPAGATTGTGVDRSPSN